MGAPSFASSVQARYVVSVVGGKLCYTAFLGGLRFRSCRSRPVGWAGPLAFERCGECEPPWTDCERQ